MIIIAQCNVNSLSVISSFEIFTRGTFRGREEGREKETKDEGGWRFVKEEIIEKGSCEGGRLRRLEFVVEGGYGEREVVE